MDTIGDLITRIRNAYLAHQQIVRVPYSRLGLAVGEILAKNNYLIAAKKVETNIEITLKYIDGEPAISKISRTSKPGRRVYSSFTKLPRILDGYGMTVVSTSQGVFIDKEARKRKLGGEILFMVW